MHAPALPRLDRYELIAGIAAGGMGAVLLARLAAAGGFQRLFAIKVLHQRYAGDSDFIEMLLDEARIAARIHHPNVVSIHEVVETEEHGYFLVMDYVEGFPLSDAIRPMAMLPFEVRGRIVTRVLLDALNGLYAAHSLSDDHGRPLNVVHRDISPQNILVGTDGVARVTDFGIAKAAARISHTRVGGVKGKLAYMAPEQLLGEPVGARTDLFALGTVLWEAMTCQRLFKGANDAETRERVLSRRIPRASEYVEKIPPEIDEVCMRALDRRVERRFASAREMAVALERAARANDLVADAHEVGEWIARTFADKLAERRAAVRNAAHDTVMGAENRAPLPDTSALDGRETFRLPLGARRAPAANAQDLDAVPTTNLSRALDASLELRAAMDAYRASLVAPPPTVTATDSNTFDEVPTERASPPFVAQPAAVFSDVVTARSGSELHPPPAAPAALTTPESFTPLPSSPQGSQHLPASLPAASIQGVPSPQSSWVEPSPSVALPVASSPHAQPAQSAVPAMPHPGMQVWQSPPPPDYEALPAPASHTMQAQPALHTPADESASSYPRGQLVLTVVLLVAGLAMIVAALWIWHSRRSALHEKKEATSAHVLAVHAPAALR